MTLKLGSEEDEINLYVTSKQFELDIVTDKCLECNIQKKITSLKPDNTSNSYFPLDKKVPPEYEANYVNGLMLDSILFTG